MKRYDFSDRIGFLVNEVGRLFGRRFDQLARGQLGLSRAQCRLIGAVASGEREQPWTQAELAQQLDLTAMGVTTLVDRMETGGWLARTPSAVDRRANAITLQPKALDALDAAIELGDAVQSVALAGFSAAERRQLQALLQRARANLQAVAGDAA